MISQPATACRGGVDGISVARCAGNDTLGGIVRRAGKHFLARRKRPLHVHRVFAAIGQCRTPSMGGHHYRCHSCGKTHQVSHCCGNRHCPLCQGREAHAWLDKQQQALLPVGYFHLVFTLPHRLNELIRFNQRTLYNLLFECVSQTLLQFGRNRLRGQIGFTAILHTWSQTLLDHYHLHVIVPAGALDPPKSQWHAANPGYLFPVRALSKLYRAKFLAGLQKLHRQGKLSFHRPELSDPAPFTRFLRRCARHKWTVFAKRPFAGPEHVLRYLSRYTHRTAISNRRILANDPRRDTVSFAWKDYADASKNKVMELSTDEFLRRFSLHILPKGFVRIRHYGFLANNCRSQRVSLIRSLLPADSTPAPGQISPPQPAPPPKCPHCGSENLTLIGTTHRPVAAAAHPSSPEPFQPRAPPLNPMAS